MNGSLHTDEDLIVQYYGPRERPPAELMPWVDLLRAWRDRHHHYRAVSKGDIGWDYSERAQVGFLAAAAWQLGGAAIEEYVTVKKDRDDRRKRAGGRADLWIGLGGKGYALEAKHATVRLDTRGTRAALVRAFDRAGFDSTCLNEETHFTGGVAFVPLYLPAELHPKQRLALLERHLNDEEDQAGEPLKAQVKTMYDYVLRADLLGHQTRRGDELDPVGLTLLIGLDRR